MMTSSYKLPLTRRIRQRLSIEKNGTGIEKNGTGIEKNGTGISQERAA